MNGRIREPSKVARTCYEGQLDVAQAELEREGRRSLEAVQKLNLTRRGMCKKLILGRLNRAEPQLSTQRKRARRVDSECGDCAKTDDFNFFKAACLILSMAWLQRPIIDVQFHSGMEEMSDKPGTN